MLWLGVTARPTAEWIARQLTEVCGAPSPRARNDRNVASLHRPFGVFLLIRRQIKRSKKWLPFCQRPSVKPPLRCIDIHPPLLSREIAFLQERQPQGRHGNLNHDAWLTEKVGVEFVAENGDGAGGRLKKARRAASTLTPHQEPLSKSLFAFWP